MKTNRLLFTPLAFALSLPASLAAQQPVGFLETFALSPDRDAALKELIPGTDETFFYSALHLQNQRKTADFRKLLEDWAVVHPNSENRLVLMRRQALIDYSTHPETTLELLKREINPNLSHQREIDQTKPDLPTGLTAENVARAAFYQRNTQGRDDLDQLTVNALETLVRDGAKLTEGQRRSLLNRVNLPDVSGLTELILTELKSQGNAGFGAFPIHARLLPEQLDELSKALPELLSNPNFVSVRMAKMRPGPETDVEVDLTARAAWLAELRAYASTLPPAMNSLKSHILYQCLDLGQRLGEFDRELLLEYLKIPRPVPYVNPLWREKQQAAWNDQANPGEDFSAITKRPPISHDEPMIRSWLLRIFETEKDPKAFAEWLEESWLRKVFAEAKILSGQNENGEYTQWLTPAEYTAIRERIDLEWDRSNPELFSVEDDISLLVATKNVPELTVKIFEINSEGWLESHESEIGTDLNLDGLTAQIEEIVKSSDAPSLRTRKKISLAGIAKKRGVWVVELVGNGRSSRALIRRGGMQFLPRNTASGLVMTITDEAGTPLPNAYATLKGVRFSPDEKTGEILIPHTTDPGWKPVILHDGEGFATLEPLTLNSESYALEAGFHVDRESVLTGAKATLVVRPRLLCNGVPVPPALLKNSRLTITGTSLEGLPTTIVIEDPKLTAEEEWVHEFQVPNRLHQITFTLSGEVPNRSQGRNDPLSASHSLALNGIDRTALLADLYLSRDGANWQLNLRGKNGEIIAERAVQLTVKAKDFASPLNFTVKTGTDGKIQLGELPDIETVTATAADVPPRTWNPATHGAAFPSTIHAATRDVIRLPWFGPATLSEADLSLLELREGQIVSNAFEKASIVDGMLEIKGLAPGDYQVLNRREGVTTSLSISPGARVGNFLLSERRMLESTPLEHLSITKTSVVDGKLIIHVAGAGRNLRLHIGATRFQPEWSALDDLGRLSQAGLITATLPIPSTQYVSGRDIGEEYRYILERRNAAKFAGVMASRPGLLLNPWAIRETDAGEQDAKAGEAYERKEDLRRRTVAITPATPVPQAMDAASRLPEQSADLSPSLNWLAKTSLVNHNLRAGKNGVIEIPVEQLGDATLITITAIDSRSAVSRMVALPAVEIAARDLRLAESLDEKRKFARVDEMLALPADKPFVIQDALSAEFEAYGTLQEIFGLLKALNPDPLMEEFSFLTQWPDLPRERQLELYSKYASHELNFFLARKDPEFFKTVIQPYLADKKDFTFMDEYLLERDLTPYLDPWKHGRLNIVEKILLSQRLGDQRAAEVRHVNDLQARLRPDRDLDRRLLETALGGMGLAGGGMAEELSKLQDEIRTATAGKPASPAEPAAAMEMPAMEAAAEEKAEGNGRFAGRMERAQSKLKAMAPARSDADEAADGLLDLSKSKDSQLYYSDSESVDPFGAVANQPAFFRPLEKTKEWAENNYHQLRITQQDASLIQVNRYWTDYANWNGKTPFLSARIVEATHSFPEMALALAVLDIPFASKSQKPESSTEGTTLRLTPKTPLLLFQQQIRPAQENEDAPKLLVGQNFYRLSERFIEKDGEKLDRFVSKEFVRGVAYGAQLVITNPTSTAQKLDALFQIPQGALPLNGGKATDSHPLLVEPYHTITLDLAFYFPSAGDFSHSPVQISKEGGIVGVAEAMTFHVVDQPTEVDKESWDYISQRGTDADVIAFLNANNLEGLNLARVAWRAGADADFFRQLTALLTERRIYSPEIFAYGIKHNDGAAIREFLLHEEAFLDRCGPALVSDLIEIRPIERLRYEHLEYDPLVNPRTHRLGAERMILNTAFWQQYQSWLRVLAFQPEQNSEDNLATTYFLLLQDRVEEAIGFFSKIDPNENGLKIQRDYAKAWLALAQDDTAGAKIAAETYKNHPVLKWREKFTRVLTQIAEAEGATSPEPADQGSEAGMKRDTQQESLAAVSPVMDLKADGKTAVLSARNIKEVTVNFYLMDLEFLFSANPFVSQDSSRFSVITPNQSETISVNQDGTEPETRIELPEAYRNKNVLVEVTAAGQRKAVALFANSLRADFMENYGIVQVAGAADGKPLSKVYVKVYALVNGQPKFHKDGYTDIRGKFDYISLNGGNNEATKFSVLLSHPEHGSLIKEVSPPTR